MPEGDLVTDQEERGNTVTVAETRAQSMSKMCCPYQKYTRIIYINGQYFLDTHYKNCQAQQQYHVCKEVDNTLTLKGGTSLRLRGGGAPPSGWEGGGMLRACLNEDW